MKPASSLPSPAPAPSVPDAAPGAPSPDASAVPTLPHEHDERAGMTGGVQSPRVQQGAKDLKRGLQDTSRAPEADAAYKRLKPTPGTPRRL